jgi:hypothetical protein
MQKIFLMALVSLFTFQVLSADNDVITQDIKRLPQKSQAFIAKYFPEEKVSYIKIDKEFMRTDYELNFVSGKEIEFNQDGEWYEIKCKKTAVPAGIIPENIYAYVAQNFSNTLITKVERQYNHYDIELSNDLDLEFDLKGNFLRMDD